MTGMLRGEVWQADLPELSGKLYVVVSDNKRNRYAESALAARLTTTSRHSHLPTKIPIRRGEQLSGWVGCDNIVELYDEDLVKQVGVLGPQQMQDLMPGILSAFGYSQPH